MECLDTLASCTLYIGPVIYTVTSLLSRQKLGLYTYAGDISDIRLVDNSLEVFSFDFPQPTVAYYRIDITIHYTIYINMIAEHNSKAVLCILHTHDHTIQNPL